MADAGDVYMMAIEGDAEAAAATAGAAGDEL
jgi:hypothetical protein